MVSPTFPVLCKVKGGGGGGGGGSDIAPETRGKAVLHFVRGTLRTDKITDTKSFCCCKGHIEPLSSSHGNGVFGRLSHNERSEMLKLSQATQQDSTHRMKHETVHVVVNHISGCCRPPWSVLRSKRHRHQHLPWPVHAKSSMWEALLADFL